MIERTSCYIINQERVAMKFIGVRYSRRLHLNEVCRVFLHQCMIVYVLIDGRLTFLLLILRITVPLDCKFVLFIKVRKLGKKLEFCLPFFCFRKERTRRSQLDYYSSSRTKLQLLNRIRE